MKIKDDYGNKLYDVKRKGGYDFYLQLKSEHYARKLGQLTNAGEFIMRRDRDEHLLVKANAYGFNEKLIRDILDPDTPIIIKEKGRYGGLKTTARDILEKGSYLFFLQQGFEKQLFMKLSRLDG